MVLARGLRTFSKTCGRFIFPKERKQKTKANKQKTKTKNKNKQKPKTNKKTKQKTKTNKKLKKNKKNSLLEQQQKKNCVKTETGKKLKKTRKNHEKKYSEGARGVMNIVVEWTRRLEFKSWTRMIAFHIALILIPVGKV